MNGFAALRAMDLATFDKRGEDHVFERFAVPQGICGPVVEHAVEHFLVPGLRRRRESAEAVAAAQFDLHGEPPGDSVFRYRPNTIAIQIPTLHFAS